MSHIMEENMKALDLFCGCGGISTGLRMAGFDVVAGVDIEKKYLATFARNFGSNKAHELNLCDISPKELMKILDIKRGELNLLAGGPPCQGFSKNIPRKNRFLDDSNNQLIKTFLLYCEAFQPQMILMENVAEMKNGFKQTYTEEIIDRLSSKGYSVTAVVLNAADYGVPQRRRRAFFLANRLGVKFKVPNPTHFKTLEKGKEQPCIFQREKHITVWEAIGDLPPLLHGEGFEESEYETKPFSGFQKIMRGNRKRVKNHVSRKLRDKQYNRLASLKPGEGLKDLPPDLKVKGGYSGAYGRLTKEMIAPTITRWVFHTGSGRWGHPVDIRTISIREIARIQSFPDKFEFVGSYTDQCGQLGNAVPPLLAKKVVESMIYQLDLSRDESNSIKSSKVNLSESEGKEKLIA